MRCRLLASGSADSFSHRSKCTCRCRRRHIKRKKINQVHYGKKLFPVAKLMLSNFNRLEHGFAFTSFTFYWCLFYFVPSRHFVRGSAFYILQSAQGIRTHKQHIILSFILPATLLLSIYRPIPCTWNNEKKLPAPATQYTILYFSRLSVPDSARISI